MAVALRCAGQSAFRVLRACCSVTGRNFILPSHKQDKEKAAPVTEVSFQKLGFKVYVTRVPRALEFLQETSLSRPPWPDLSVIDPVEGEKQQLAVISKVNNILATEKYGRLFAVVHFASRQWKVTNEDLILIENHIDAECGERIRLEKVLLVGSADFTLIGRPLLGRNLVSVEATVIEKTKSWPMVHMRFWKRHRYQRKRIIVQPQTVLRINAIRVAPDLA